jgi:hypothetical protein
MIGSYCIYGQNSVKSRVSEEQAVNVNRLAEIEQLLLSNTIKHLLKYNQGSYISR